MIAGLRGRVFKVGEDFVFLETPGGVIYKVKVPNFLLSKISKDEEILLYTYTYFSTNGFELYGFEREEELKVFEALLEIPGIGPSMALRVLSDLSISELASAVKTGNVNILKKVKGLGTKKAEMIIFALKDSVFEIGVSDEENQAISEALQALVSLGLDYPKARKLVNMALKEGAKTTEELVMFSLKNKDNIEGGSTL
ncbi:MAG: Holliday junction branch migration protein RuvA [Candidatus Caldipriscus sp.]|nr:Holliday junction branch migration protein RuvA [Candidatus Caldipriscus sp.]